MLFAVKTFEYRYSITTNKYKLIIPIPEKKPKPPPFPAAELVGFTYHFSEYLSPDIRTDAL